MRRDLSLRWDLRRNQRNCLYVSRQLGPVRAGQLLGRHRNVSDHLQRSWRLHDRHDGRLLVESVR